MPERILRPGILTSDRVNALSWPAEVFYRRLMSVVDDFGRYDARASILRAALYPLKLGSVSEADIGKWMRDCAAAGLVSLYSSEKREYVEVTDFRQRMRAAKSKYPAPTESCCHPHDNVLHPHDNANGGGGGDVVGDGGVGETGTTGKPGHARRADVSTDELFLSEIRRHYPDLDVDAEIRKMKAWLLTPRGKGKALSRQRIINWLNRCDPPIKTISRPVSAQKQARPDRSAIDPVRFAEWGEQFANKWTLETASDQTIDSYLREGGK